MVCHNKIINRTRSTKKQENSAQLFEDNYLTNHLVKFLQERIKPGRVGVGVGEYALVITFLKEKR